MNTSLLATKAICRSIYFCLILTFSIVGQLAAQSQPNILLVIADDMGIDALNGFGITQSNAPVTPHIDQLRNDGLTFSNAWATPACTPTRAAIMSGKYGINTGVMRPPGHLDLVHESIFTYVKNNAPIDYSTALIGKWHISSPADNNHPSAHGVDHFEGIIAGVIQDYYNWPKVKNGQSSQQTEYVTTHLTNAALDWIDIQTQPWLLCLSHIAPHTPWQIPPAGLYQTNNPTTNAELYKATIEALDYEVGRLLNTIDPTTLDNTVIIFIGDNGTPNRVLSHYPNGHGKSSLYEGGLRVPMIIAGKDVTRTGEVESGLSQTTDIYATIAEITSSTLNGGIHNSYSLKSTLTTAQTIERNYIYSDFVENNILEWAIKNEQYKLIEDENGQVEFYDISMDISETNNLVGNMTAAQISIMQDFQAEATAIRSGWSCRDFIQNGSETTIDDCSVVVDDCPEVDLLSYDNIGCCESPEFPSVYHEYLENNQRNIYSNGFPNHDYCYNPTNVPVQHYNFFRLEKDPVVTGQITTIVRDNGRPARHFGVALNGVMLSPAPGLPFVYENKTTGEFNWDWVFEPTTNQGSGDGQVKLDCATAHTSNAAGYHYHGEMYEYLESVEPGITSAPSVTDLFQVGWASDGHPIIYKFGPDANGVIKELLPSYALKAGTRLGDGITAPCGLYTGKYTNDFEYSVGLGDLDECNGIASSITLTTEIGVETFNYFYVVTSDFPQVSRCLVGNVSEDFENGQEDLTGVDSDGDGYIAQFDCNDSDANIFPCNEEIPYNGIDDDCDALTLDDDLDQDGFGLTDDCDDTNSSINPSQTEITGNSIDDDCNPATLDAEIETTETDLAPIITVTPSIVTGISNLYMIIDVNDVGGRASSGVIRVNLPVDPRFTFTYDNTLTNLGFNTVDNIDWTYVGNNGLFHTFEFSGIIAAMSNSTLGLEGTFNAQNSDGSTTFTCTVRPYDGGEQNVSNNSDSEFVDFFK